MVQLWPLPFSGTTRAGVALKTDLYNALQSLRTSFSGAALPIETVAGMLAINTTDGLLYRRNQADTDWVCVGSAGSLGRHAIRAELLALSTTQARRICAPLGGMVVERVVLLSDTASTSSSGNEWQVELRNVTAGVDLFSGVVGTFTALGGVGGGAELAVDVPFVLTPDQNATLAPGDVLKLTATAVGSVTTLAELSAIVEGFAAA